MIKIFLILFFSSQVFAAGGITSVKLLAGSAQIGTTVISGDGTATVYKKDSLTTHIQGRQASATSPSLSFTVVAGTYCDVHLSTMGILAGGGATATMGLKQGANYILYLSVNAMNGATGGVYSGGHTYLRLEAGSYTFDTIVAYSAGGGYASYYGFCYTIK